MRNSCSSVTKKSLLLPLYGIIINEMERKGCFFYICVNISTLHFTETFSDFGLSPMRCNEPTKPENNSDSYRQLGKPPKVHIVSNFLQRFGRERVISSQGIGYRFKYSLDIFLELESNMVFGHF